VALGNITLLAAEKQKAPAHHMQGLKINFKKVFYLLDCLII
jgi:hypothetical protein